MGEWIEKQVRVVDPAAIKRARLTWCELCGQVETAYRGIEVHHHKTRGAGGGDVDDNLVSLCVTLDGQGCHQRRHRGQISWQQIQDMIDRRSQPYL